MPVTLRNNLNSVLDVPGSGLIFEPYEEKTVVELSPELSAAIRSGHLDVIAQEDALRIAVEHDGEAEFDLPFAWPGPDRVHLCVGGLIQHFGVDWTVDPATNRMQWLDDEIVLKTGDRLIFVGRAS